MRIKTSEWKPSKAEERKEGKRIIIEKQKRSGFLSIYSKSKRMNTLSSFYLFLFLFVSVSVFCNIGIPLVFPHFIFTIVYTLYWILKYVRFVCFALEWTEKEAKPNNIFVFFLFFFYSCSKFPRTTMFVSIRIKIKDEWIKHV